MSCVFAKAEIEKKTVIITSSLNGDNPWWLTVQTGCSENNEKSVIRKYKNEYTGKSFHTLIVLEMRKKTCRRP